MEIFDHLNNLTAQKRDIDFNNDEVKKTYNKYMVNRFVSMSELYIPLVNAINQFDLPEETHYRYYFSTLPKRKIFFSYIKKKKDVNEEELKYLAHYFECGKKDAEQMINILDEDTISEILNIYKYGKNKMVEI